MSLYRDGKNCKHQRKHLIIQKTYTSYITIHDYSTSQLFQLPLVRFSMIALFFWISSGLRCSLLNDTQKCLFQYLEKHLYIAQWIKPSQQNLFVKIQHVVHIFSSRCKILQVHSYHWQMVIFGRDGVFNKIIHFCVPFPGIQDEPINCIEISIKFPNSLLQV